MHYPSHHARHECHQHHHKNWAIWNFKWLVFGVNIVTPSPSPLPGFFWQFCWSWVWELSARLPWDFWDFLTACCLCLCCQHRQHHHRHRHHYGQHCRLVLMGRRAKGLEISRIFWLTHFKTMPLCTLFFLGLCHRLCHLDHDCNNVEPGAADPQINPRVVTPHCSNKI